MANKKRPGETSKVSLPNGKPKNNQQKRIEDLERQKNDLTTRLKSLQEEFESCQSKCSSLETQSAELATRRASLEINNRALAEQLQNNLAELEQTQSDRRRLEAQSKEADNSISDLKVDLTHSKAQVEKLQRRIEEEQSQRVKAQRAQNSVRSQLEACRSSKMVLEQEKSQIQQELVRVKLEYSRKLILDVAPVLELLCGLARLDPEPVQGLSARAVFERMLDWIQQVLGDRPMPFPAKFEMRPGNLLILDPDESGMESLVARFDWSPEHPFDGLSAGSRHCRFRLLRWGWKAGNEILVRAQIVPDPDTDFVSSQ